MESFSDRALDEKNLMYILKATLAGRVNIWAVIETEDGKADVLAMLATTAQVDNILGETNLQILALHAWKYIPRSVWAEQFDKLREYAVRRGYKNIVGWTSNKKLLLVSEALGGDTNIRMVRLEV